MLKQRETKLVLNYKLHNLLGLELNNIFNQPELSSV